MGKCIVTESDLINVPHRTRITSPAASGSGSGINSEVGCSARGDEWATICLVCWKLALLRIVRAKPALVVLPRRYKTSNY